MWRAPRGSMAVCAIPLVLLLSSESRSQDTRSEVPVATVGRKATATYPWQIDADYVVQFDAVMAKPSTGRRLEEAIRSLPGTKNVRAHGQGHVSFDLVRRASLDRSALAVGITRVLGPSMKMGPAAFLVIEPRLTSEMVVARALKSLTKLSPGARENLFRESKGERAGDRERFLLLQEVFEFQAQFARMDTQRVAGDPALRGMIRCLDQHRKLLRRRGYSLAPQPGDGQPVSTVGSPVGPGVAGFAPLRGQKFTHPRSQLGRSLRWVDLRLLDHYDTVLRAVLRRAHAARDRAIRGKKVELTRRFEALAKIVEPFSRRIGNRLSRGLPSTPGMPPFMIRGEAIPSPPRTGVPPGTRR